MAALPLTSITPLKSGDVFRAYYLKDEIPMSKIIGTVLSERIFDIFSLILLSLIGSLLFYNIKFLVFLVPALIIISAFLILPKTELILPFIKGPWQGRFQNVIYSLRSLRNNMKAFFFVLSLSLASWIITIFQTILFFYSLDIKIPFFFTMANIPIAIFIGLFPVTLGGMGTRDAAIIFLFSDYASQSALLSVGILFSAFRYWFLIIIGIPFMKKIITYR